MKGDFSRWNFDEVGTENDSGVLQQQGKVLLDSDWNAQDAITRGRLDRVGLDTIGPRVAAVPVAMPDGFKIASAESDDSEPRRVELTLKPGTVWIDGMPVRIGGQSDVKRFAMGEETRSREAVVLEVWREAINAFQEPERLLEPALGGTDTTERIHTATAFKLVPLANSQNCDNIVSSLGDDFNQKGHMRATLQPTEETGGDCPGVAAGGYTGFEHRLYRIEVAAVDGSANMFKWSRQNGGLVGRGSFNEAETKIDITHNFNAITTYGRTDFYMEILSYHDKLGHWRVETGAKVTLSDSSLEITDQLYGAGTETPNGNFFFRLWDGIEDISQFPAVSSPTLPDELEDGIRLEFSQTAQAIYKPGDYWTFTVRAGGLQAGGTLLPQQPPRGIYYHRVPLAILEWQPGMTQLYSAQYIKDCRHIFPNLTDITAADVIYKNNYCEMAETGKLTVQDALDFLCRRKQTCTLVVVPKVGWEKVFDLIGDNRSAQICFQVGTYYLDHAVHLHNKGNLKITGCGSGTRIIVKNCEAAFIFKNCKEVTVRDLYAESRVTGARWKLHGLTGVFSFRDCDTVHVDNVAAKNASGPYKASTCLTVKNTASSVKTNKIKGTVNVMNSRFTVGHHQVGVLLINVNRGHIENNLVTSGKLPKEWSFDKLTADKYYLGLVRDMMVSAIFVGQEKPGGSAANQTLNIAGRTVHFKTDRNLVGKWTDVPIHIDSSKIKKDKDVKTELLNIAGKIIKNKGDLGTIPHFRFWYRDLSKEVSPAGQQGIVAAGSVIRDLRIINNTVLDVFQGIRLGVSHREQHRGTPDIAGNANISGNTIKISLPPVATHERFGIFLGNCNSSVMENNSMSVTLRATKKWDKPYVEGIRVFGHLGKRMIIRQNHMENFSLGIFINPLNYNDYWNPLWLVEDNVASIKVSDTPEGKKAKVKDSRNYG